MQKELKARDIERLVFGVLLFGIAAIIIALAVAGWYFIDVLPRSRNITLSNSDFKLYPYAWCDVVNGKAFITIYTRDYAASHMRVHVGGKIACEYNEIPLQSSEVCEADVNDMATFRITYTIDGQKRVLSGICAKREMNWDDDGR